MIPAIIIFAATYVVMAIGRLPGYRLDRAGAALLGASLMVAFGVLDLGQAFAAIDMATITLLFGMMIVVANLRLSGFFRLATAWAIARAGHPLVLLGAVVAVTGVLSAFLVNDAICIVMAPLVLDLVVRLKRNPVPYLLAVAMASNAGSVATITGNPQNMIIGSLSKVPYGTFAATLSPVALFALLCAFLLIAVSHPAEFLRGGRLQAADAGEVHYHRPLVLKSLAVLAAMVVLFFAACRWRRSPSLAAPFFWSRAASIRRRSISTSTGRFWSCSRGCSSSSTAWRRRCLIRKRSRQSAGSTSTARRFWPW